jgi:hypothetical protein
VTALGEERQFDGLADEEVLTLAAQEERILVTFDVAHFPPILQEWAAAGRSHSGVILVYGIDHSEFGLIVRGIERWLARRPAEDAWVDFPAVLDRAFATSQ